MMGLDFAAISSHDYVGFTLNGKRYSPTISELHETESKTKIITLDASLQSELNWSLEENLALEMIEKGYTILWYIDFALELERSRFFDPLHFHSLQIALDHFQKTLLQQFKAHTLGLILFKGRVSSTLREDLIEFIHLLAASLPVELALFLLFDLSEHKSIAEKIYFLSKSDFSKYYLCVKDGVDELPFLTWKEKRIFFNSHEKKKNVLLIPTDISSLDISYKIEEMMKRLEGISFHILFEEDLNMHWEGVETILVKEEILRESGKRMLAGFLATGGHVQFF